MNFTQQRQLERTAMTPARTIRFYTKGELMGSRKMSKYHIIEAVQWIQSGNDIKINGQTFNCPVSVTRHICENSEKNIIGELV